MDIQEIFSRVISSGKYGTDETTHYMCIALMQATWDDTITLEEFRYTSAVIREYVGGKGRALVHALEQRGLPYKCKDRLAIYTDWENRPCLD